MTFSPELKVDAVLLLDLETTGELCSDVFWDVRTGTIISGFSCGRGEGVETGGMAV